MTTLSVGPTIADGLDRVRDPELVVLVAAAYLFQVGALVGMQSQLAVQRETLEAEPAPFGVDLAPETLPLAFEIPLAVASILWMVSMVLLVTLSLVVLRLLITEDGDDTGSDDADVVDDSRQLDSESQTDGIGRLTIRGIGAGIVGSLVVGVGLVLFVLPGLFAATVFAFTLPYIASRGTGVIEGMKRSYELTRGIRLRVFVLLLAIVVGFLAVSFVGGSVALALQWQPIAAELANVAFATLAWLFVLAVLASAFDRLEAARAEEAEKWDGIDDELLP